TLHLNCTVITTENVFTTTTDYSSYGTCFWIHCHTCTLTFCAISTILWEKPTFIKGILQSSLIILIKSSVNLKSLIHYLLFSQAVFANSFIYYSIKEIWITIAIFISKGIPQS